MEKYLYNPKNNAFYPYSLQEEYKSSGSWPTSGVDVDESVFAEFSGEQPAGKIRIAGVGGYPAWGDIPPPTPDELIAQAEAKKAELISDAKKTISIWQSELLLGEISDDDKASLTEWISYIKALQKVDSSKGPDIVWPDAPTT